MERQELIGNEAEITASKNKCADGLKGKIIDETKNTITILTQGKKRKKLAKSTIKFTITREGSKTEIDGSGICLSPEDRIKSR